MLHEQNPGSAPIETEHEFSFILLPPLTEQNGIPTVKMHIYVSISDRKRERETFMPFMAPAANLAIL